MLVWWVHCLVMSMEAFGVCLVANRKVCQAFDRVCLGLATALSCSQARSTLLSSRSRAGSRGLGGVYPVAKARHGCFKGRMPSCRNG